MLKAKKVIGSTCAALMLMCILGAVPALAASTTVTGVAMNKIYNTTALGGEWNNQGKSNSAYSNFYHPGQSHYSIVGASSTSITSTGSAGAGNWSYATLSMSFPSGTTFNFTCGTN